jgi:endonuclease YncB( thermonuclease family)
LCSRSPSNLNREIVQAGFAWWYRQYARHDKELERLEGEAKAAKRGLWVDKDPMPPWEFRRLR